MSSWGVWSRWPEVLPTRRLDVQHLEPCEPLQLSLEAVAELRSGECLQLLHRREPFPLYELLKERGMAWSTVPGTQSAFEVWIWHASDSATAAAVATELEGR